MGFQYELHANRLEELKQEAKRALVSTNEPRAKLKLIDSIQRLGVAYHFEREIEEAIKLTEVDVNGDLHTTSLHFRLLRQHAFSVSTGDITLTSLDAIVPRLFQLKIAISMFIKTSMSNLFFYLFL